MIKVILLSILFYGGDSTANHPIQVVGSKAAVETLVRILNSELPSNVGSVQAMNLETGEYGISLTRKLETPGWLTRENRFNCTLNYLLGDSLKVVHLRLVENDPRVLISDGRKGVIDIADIEKFNTSQDDNFTAFNVLLHELYEQHQLQAVENLQPGKVSSNQLKVAHMKAVQKESNFYDLTMLRTEADIHKNYIHIEFTNRINDLYRHHFYAYFHNGNVTKVEKGSD